MSFHEVLLSYGDIIIIGYAELGEYLFRELSKTFPSKNIIVCDNFLGLQGKTIKEEKKILSVEAAVKMYPTGYYIPTSIHRNEMMHSQLNSLGINDDQILLSSELMKFEQNRQKIIRTTPKEYLSLWVDAARHCNLNCIGCTHYSPLSKEQYLDIDSFSNDLQRLAQIENGILSDIWFIGGEPLLNVKLTKCIKLVKKYLNHTNVKILTNGLLLSKMTDEFWKTCAELNVIIKLSEYPIKIDYKSIKDFVSSKGIICESSLSSAATSGYFYRFPFDLDGTRKPYESFVNCINANYCTTLREGKIYPCPAVAFVDTFNDYFNTKLAVSEEDYIDIYKVKSANDILKHLARPIPFCRYCKSDERYDIPWSVSRKSIKEWL